MAGLLVNKNSSKKKKKKDKKLDSISDSIKTHTYYVYLSFVEKRYTLKEIPKYTLVKDFQKRIEITCGIPLNLQLLYYLDGCTLDSNTVLNNYDIVNKATFTLKVLGKWENLIKAIYKNDISERLKQFHKRSPENITLLDENSSYLEKENELNYCLFIASHLGRTDIIKELLRYNVDINAKTILGHTPLHAAIANGQYDCINVLLENGANGENKSPAGQYASFVAKLNGHSDSDRHVFMFNWQQRAKSLRSPVLKKSFEKSDKYFDSKCPTWFSGTYGTKYMCTTTIEGEFSGTGFSAPKRKRNECATGKGNKMILNARTNKQEKDHRKSFEMWLKNKEEQEKVLALRKEQSVQQIQHTQEKHVDKSRKLIQRKKENDKRLKQVRDDIEKHKKTNIYEDYVYIPHYGRTVVSKLMSEISLHHSA